MASMSSSFQGKSAVVIGGSSGIGRATVKALVAGGARTTAVARDVGRLRALEDEVGGGHGGGGPLRTLPGDATDPGLAGRLLGELRPDLVVLTAGGMPPMGTVDELDWESFSHTWNSDTRASFLLVKQALTQPLAPGSTVVLVSSGAALFGSPLSGGYAGAKRMQWLLATYAQKVSDARQLGIRTLAVLPKQLIEGTTIGAKAAAAYGALNGTSAEEFMKRYEVPLDPGKVAAAILAAACGEVATGITGIAVTGAGIEPLP
jgi:NAD(P)-dependent dehydrogenase (short-subunit alcohol dehydrogenase family)